MKRFSAHLGIPAVFLLFLLLPLLPSCMYHLGGLKSRDMEGMKTFCVDMFANQTTQPQVSMQMTTALADALQRDGTYRMASPDTCDFRVSGVVSSVSAYGLTTNPDDTYISSEIGLNVTVHYTITDCRTSKCIKTGIVRAEGSFFNTTGNIQQARDDALSYATRKAASDIVNQLTIP